MKKNVEKFNWSGSIANSLTPPWVKFNSDINNNVINLYNEYRIKIYNILKNDNTAPKYIRDGGYYNPNKQSFQWLENDFWDYMLGYRLINAYNAIIQILIYAKRENKPQSLDLSYPPNEPYNGYLKTNRIYTIKYRFINRSETFLKWKNFKLPLYTYKYSRDGWTLYNKFYHKKRELDAKYENDYGNFKNNMDYNFWLYLRRERDKKLGQEFGHSGIKDTGGKPSGPVLLNYRWLLWMANNFNYVEEPKNPPDSDSCDWHNPGCWGGKLTNIIKDGIEDGINSMKDLGNIIKEGVQEVGSSVEDLAEDIKNMVEDVVSIDKYKDFIENIFKKISGPIEDSIKDRLDNVTDIKDLIKKYINEVKNGINDMADIKNKIEDILDVNNPTPHRKPYPDMSPPNVEPPSKPKIKTDCEVSSWSDWSICNASCGGGIKSRIRSIRIKPENGGKKCPELKEFENCNTKECNSKNEIKGYGRSYILTEYPRCPTNYTEITSGNECQLAISSSSHIKGAYQGEMDLGNLYTNCITYNKNNFGGYFNKGGNNNLNINNGDGFNCINSESAQSWCNEKDVKYYCYDRAKAGNCNRTNFMNSCCKASCSSKCPIGNKVYKICRLKRSSVDNDNWGPCIPKPEITGNNAFLQPPGNIKVEMDSKQSEYEKLHGLLPRHKFIPNFTDPYQTTFTPTRREQSCSTNMSAIDPNKVNDKITSPNDITMQKEICTAGTHLTEEQCNQAYHVIKNAPGKFSYRVDGYVEVDARVLKDSMRTQPYGCTIPNNHYMYYNIQNAPANKNRAGDWSICHAVSY